MSAQTPPIAGGWVERVRDPFWDRYYVWALPQMRVSVWGQRRWI